MVFLLGFLDVPVLHHFFTSLVEKTKKDLELVLCPPPMAERTKVEETFGSISALI